MSHSDALKLLFPLDLGGSHAADLALEGQQLDRAASSAAALLAEIYPDTAVQFLASWERVLGIAPASDAKRSERVAEVIFRLRALGRLDRQYYIDIAATVGYAITITELKPLMAGWMQSGQEVQAEHVRWIWTVTIAEGFAQYARAGAMAAGEPIAWYRDDRHLKSIFADLKPAHTQVVFV